MTKIAKVIADSGYKKGYIAKQIGISHSALAKIISGETKEPKLSVAIKLSRFLGVSIDELWGHLVE